MSSVDLPILIQELRERLRGDLTEFYDTDFNLERFIIGCKYDMDEAETKLRKHLILRKIMKMDDPVENFKMNPILMKYYPGSSLDTLDRSGSFIHIMCHCKTDNHGLMKSLTNPDYYKSRVYYAERVFRQIMDQEAKTGKRTSTSIIFDLDGFTFDPSLITVFQGPYGKLLNLLTENYMEVADRIYVINESMYMYAMWKILEPFVPAGTRHKIQVMGSDWKTALSEFIPPESLPTNWGGTLDADDKVIVPSPVPESLYLPPNPEVEARMSTAYAGRGSTLVLKFLPPTGAKTLHYWLHLDGEVTFCVYRSSIESDTVPENAEHVYPEFVFLKTLAAPSDDVIDCTAGGVYYMTFKNDGWFFSKTVRYLVEFE